MSGDSVNTTSKEGMKHLSNSTKTGELLATAQQEIELAHQHGLVAWNRTEGGYVAVQIVMPDEGAARELVRLIETQHNNVNDLLARQSTSQENRWVVQVPAGQAEAAGLLPKDVTLKNLQTRLPFGLVAGNMKGANEARVQMRQASPSKPRARMQAGISAVGLVQGTRNLTSAYNEGDTVGTAIAGSDVATSGISAVVDGVESTGKSLSPAIRGSLTKANIAVALADGVYQVAKEDGATHKTERAAAVAATTGAGLAAGSALSGGLVVGGLAATGATAAAAGVAAPVVVAGAAAYGTTLIAETAIDTRRIYEREDRRFSTSADSRHLIAVQHRLADKIKDAGISRTETGDPDYSDPLTVGTIRRLIEAERVQCKGIIASNDSWVPRWLRWGERIARYNDASSDLAILGAALKELEQRWRNSREIDAGRQQVSATKLARDLETQGIADKLTFDEVTHTDADRPSATPDHPRGGGPSKRSRN